MTRSEYFVCSLSGASGVSVIVLSPSVNVSVLAMVPLASDKVMLVPLTVAGSTGSDMTTRTGALFEHSRRRRGRDDVRDDRRRRIERDVAENADAGERA